jgi:hypothetical protein
MGGGECLLFRAAAPAVRCSLPFPLSRDSHLAAAQFAARLVDLWGKKQGQMDPHLLSRLPDAAKLSVLRQLGQLHLDSKQRDASTTDPRQPQEHRERPPPAAANSSAAQRAPLPSLLAGRQLVGGLAAIDGFINSGKVKAARAEAADLLSDSSRADGMATAADGRVWASSAARGDRACWLAVDALLAAGHRHLAAVVQRLLELRPWLQQQGYDVGGRPSVQLACHPGGGTRCIRHRDASASVPHRTVTAIAYLNPKWIAGDGGALCVYTHSSSGSHPCAASAADLSLAGAAVAVAAAAAAAQQVAAPRSSSSSSDSSSSAVGSGLDEGHPATVVPPIGGRLVAMDSRLLHEVLPAQAERYAVTVWFSKAPPAAAVATAVGTEEAAARPGQQDATEQRRRPSTAVPTLPPAASL